MAILAGKRLGPYEILSAIGAGGMGEVYRARDTRLERIVAVKILPDHLSDRAELRERFEREARTIASLNHPHICVLHDIGQQDGIDYLVMEYLEGETLSERLKKGPLPLDQVLQYAVEISDALDKAHRKGITHRDLKPGNIMLTKSATKLLDFGLAKLRGPQVAVANLSALPTEGSNLTAQGTILGTLQYMAPEQLEGKEVDARTDIFAFGVVVYEMATGKKAFEGKSQASLIAKILETDPPPISSLQPMTPPALDRVVKKCLAKEPEKRWQDASDLCDELKWIAESGARASLSTAGVTRSPKSRRKTLLWAAASLAVSAVVGLTVWHFRPEQPRPVTRFTISLPAGQRLVGLDTPAIALSPDGTRLAYIGAQDNALPQLYLRAMASPDARPIPGTDGATDPFFSPDGQWLGFFTGGKLKKVSVSGGASMTLGDASAPQGASWGSQGMIAFGSEQAAVLLQVSDAGGAPQALTHLDKGETDHDWPEFLPGGKTVLFAASGDDRANGQVAIQSLATGARRNLIQGATHPHYAPSGHLVYAQGGNLMAVPFDLQRLALTGAAVPVVEGVLQSTSSGGAQYNFSATGSLVYVAGAVQATAGNTLVWVSRNGIEQPLPAPLHEYGLPRLSPEGRRLAVLIGDQVWLYDLSRETLSRFTFEGAENRAPVWTPDGKRIAFRSTKEGPSNIFWQLADGSGGLERLTTSEYDQISTSWSPDGQALAFVQLNPNKPTEIWVMRMGDRKAQPFLQTRFNEAAPRFSPDGHWLAYGSDESGRSEIYVQPYPGPGGKWQISTEGGTEPVWNPNGRELFYRSGDKMMAVDIVNQPGFAAGRPRKLFEGRYVANPVNPNYDVSRDGQRFLMTKESEQNSSATQINVVLNWFEELKQKVPTGEEVMALATGTKLGPYEITGAIGAGGMGEVYRARDTRLERIVAVKILPDHLSDRAELRERFEREARTIASLNHPHICTLHDIGHQDGTDFLVMEYLEGETLSERLKKGPLPLDQVLQYAIEIADALDKAHRKGITHRDLKPGNIMLTKSGTKLLDFGLAKLRQDVVPGTPLSQLPTAKEAITAQGTILGTLQYMAPEQVEGREVDARTDIFAFGVVGYEMATGKKAFEGKTSASVMAKILEVDPPPISSLQPMTPPALDRVVKRCLAKEPEKRWQTASDLCEELKWIAEEGTTRAAFAAVPAASRRKNWLKMALWSAAALGTSFIVGFTVWSLKPAAPKPVTRFAMSLPPGQRLDTFGPAIAISPDGTRLVYAAGPSNLTTQLYIREMGGLEVRPIPGTGGGGNPFFSPDGQWIGFATFGELMKVSLSGGAPVSLGPVNFSGFSGASWGSQGRIAVVPQAGSPIQQIPDTGGNLQPLTRLEKGEASHRWPEFLPDGKNVLFTVGAGTATKIAVQSLGSGEHRGLIAAGDFPRYAFSGHLVYLQGANLMAVPFDLQRLAITGAAVPVIEGVQTVGGGGAYSFSSTGTLIYTPGSVQAAGSKLVWVDRKGIEQPVNAPPHNYVLPKVSPDGKHVAAGIEEADSQIWVYDLGRDTLTRLTFEGGSNIDPVWTPDGKRIVYKGTGNRLFWQPADGSAGAEALTGSELAANNVPGSWTPDGQVLTFMEVNPDTGYDVYTLSLKDGKPQPFLRTASVETAPRFSPDGRFIAYASDESGRIEIYVRSYPGPGGKWQISSEGGSEPVWNPKGRELFYRAGNKMMAVDVTVQPTFSAGKPRTLFEGPYVPTPRSFPDYDVSPDGQRFLMLKPSEQTSSLTQIVVVQNWFEELKQKVPAAKK